MYTMWWRRTGVRRSYMVGFTTDDINYLENLANDGIDSGEYTSAMIVDARNGKVVRKIYKSTK